MGGDEGGGARLESVRPERGALGGQWEILERIACGSSLDELLHSIVALVEHRGAGLSCTILLSDTDTNQLRHGAAQRLSPALCAHLDGLRIGPDMGSCGAAAFHRRPVIVTDIASHPSWQPFRERFLAEGLRACWSTPILSPARELLGTLAMYFVEPRGPSADECAWADAATHLAAIALARARSERENARLLHTLEQRVNGLRDENQEHARLAAQLGQSQRIQALGTLAGGIAHDFNNILTAIAGHTHLALNDIEEERSPQDSLLAIQEASTRAVELVRRVLMFSRHQQPELELCSIVPIVEESVQQLGATLQPGVRVELEPTAQRPLAFADAGQLHTIVVNLVANAAHALGQRGGSIRVAIDSVPSTHDEVTQRGDRRFDRYVRLSISDTGPGMDEATLERIFEPFFTTKPTGQGNGLGLSVVHGIVQGHEGFIAVQSQPGRGSVFRIYLPESREASPHLSLPAPARTRSRPGRVMYVDDEEPLVMLAMRWLGRLGYQVTGFSDSTQALAAFRARPFDFDALISDLSMPGLSGLDLVREVRALRKDLVVVVSSGYLGLDDQQRAKELGAVDVVLKPQSMAEFGRILDRILSDSIMSDSILSGSGEPR